jgi:hypothetical protein
MPPQCKVMATFKGHAFYMNCVDPPSILLRVGTFLGAMGDAATGASATTRTNGIGTRTPVGNISSGSPTVSSVSAADMRGIVVGQRCTDSRFTFNSTILSVTASSFTLSSNSSATAAATTISFLTDVLEVDGTSVSVTDAGILSLLPAFVGSRRTLVVQALDRVVPASPGGTSSTNPASVFADGILISRWYLAEGHSSSITIRGTNGQNYTPQLPIISASPTTIAETARPNGISWSEQNQPERVCALSTAFVGSGEIYAAFSTRDALWIFASDGLWRLSGTGGNAGDGYDWRVDPVDSTISISGPQAGCVLRDTVYAYTNRGFVSIDSSGNIRELSMGRINDLMPGPPWSTPVRTITQSMWTIADETHDEIVFTVGINQSGRVYVYNTLTDAFTYFAIQLASALWTPMHAAYLRATEEVIYAQQAASSVLGRSGGTYAAHRAVLQPVGGDNPFVMRHWQNVNYVLAQAAAAQPIVPVINGTAFSAAVTPTLMGDSGQQRVSVGVPRNSPAIANQISVGFSGAGSSSTARKLYAIALDYVDMTDQRRKR